MAFSNDFLAATLPALQQPLQGVPLAAAPAPVMPISGLDANVINAQQSSAAMSAPVPPAPANIAPSLIPGVENVGMGGAVAPVQAITPEAQAVPVAAPPPAPEPAPPPMPAAAPAQAASAIPPGIEKPQISIRRTSGSTAREAPTVGPKALGMYDEAVDARITGAQQAERAAQANYATQAVDALAGKEQAEKDATRARETIAAQQQHLDYANNAVQTARDDVAKEIPLTDYWTDKGVGAKIGIGIAMAVAGIGQAISGDRNENPVARQLRDDMNTDLRMKQMRAEQTMRGRQMKLDASQQYFNNLVRKYGMSGATEMWAASQHDKAVQEARLIAAKTGSAEAQANFAQFASEQLAKGQERHAAALKFIPAQSGGINVFDPDIGVEVPLDQYRKYRIDQAKEGFQQQGKERLAGMKEGQERVDKGTQFIAEQYQKGKMPQYRAAVEEASRLQREVGDAGTGTLSRGLWEISPRLYNARFGEQATAREQAFSVLKNVKVKEEAGGNVTQGEWDRQVMALYAAKDDASRQRAIASLDRMLAASEQNVLAGAGPEASARYKENLAREKGPKIDFKPSGGK